jgi:hypothetical protein
MVRNDCLPCNGFWVVTEGEEGKVLMFSSMRLCQHTVVPGQDKRWSRCGDDVQTGEVRVGKKP